MILTLENAPVPAIGDMAPDFTLPSANGGEVTLSSRRGKSPVLLAFFPLAFTGTCTAELCAMTDDYDAFVEAGAEVLGISVDSTASLREYRDKYSLRVELLSDFRRETSAAYGVLLEEKFYSKRAYFLVDATGVIRWTHIEVQTRDKRDNDELLRAVRAVAHHRPGQ